MTGQAQARDVNGWPMCRCGPSVSARPTQAPPVDPGQDADVTVWDVRVQIGASPSQRIQAPQHVVAVGDVYGAEIEEIEREVLPVVGDCDKLDHAENLARMRYSTNYNSRANA